MDTISVYNLDEAYVRIDCELGLAKEMSDHFTFDVPGAKYMPAYKNKIWDGKIRLLNIQNMTIYKGLTKHIENFCVKRGYTFTDQDGILIQNDISLPELSEFLIGSKFTPRDYQLRAVAHALRNTRSMILSPTASGKSFIIYCLLKYLMTHEPSCKKTLIIVPTTSLVHQMDNDFKEYGNLKESQDYYTHKIMSGQEKNNPDANIFISTWQSIFKMPKKWFDQFDIVVGDEAHLFKAQSLIKIMTKLTKCKYRFGFTGTMDGTETNRLVLEGLFGPTTRVIQTKELIENKTLSDFRIKSLVLKYDESTCKLMRDADYRQEIDFLIANEKRNNFIKNLTLSREGNTLLLFQMVERHGKVLYDMIEKDVDEGRKVFFIHGGTDAETREQIRGITEKESDAILVASYGTFSTGINIRNLSNIIFSSPSKSRVRTLQSIGRGLRKSEHKNIATLYDIADDLRYRKSVNHTYRHFGERLKMYKEEEFTNKIYEIGLKNG